MTPLHLRCLVSCDGKPSYLPFAPMHIISDLISQGYLRHTIRGFTLSESGGALVNRLVATARDWRG